MAEKILDWLPLLVGLTTGFFALLQIRSNNIINARIKWLENLKQIITDFFTESTVLLIKNGIKENTTIVESNLKSYNDLNFSIIDHLKVLESKYFLIKLNLNPKESLHQRLEIFLEEYMDLINEIPKIKDNLAYKAHLRKMNPYSDLIIDLLRIIMKLEWEKTKRWKFSNYYYTRFGEGKALKSEGLKLELSKFLK